VRAYQLFNVVNKREDEKKIANNNNAAGDDKKLFECGMRSRVRN
jgi:hypothetical protein